jgi:hypothetical protein
MATIIRNLFVRLSMMDSLELLHDTAKARATLPDQAF